MAVLSKQVVVDYLIAKYKEKFNGDRITPIKLQKGLYFLYAFWGGKIRSQNISAFFDDISEMTEMPINYDEDLFDASFEAWAYGPVDREIYIWYKELDDASYKAINIPSLTGIDEVITGYIDDLINKIINTNDFVLVDLSHEDKCWSNVFDPTRKVRMSNDSIKSEYAV